MSLRLPVLVSVLALASPAAADVLSVTAALHGGGAGGTGVAGDAKGRAFSSGARGGSYGFLIGAEILFIDVWAEHHQYVDSGGLAGTWTQIMTGLDVDIDLGKPEPLPGKKPDPKAPKPRAKGYLELGIATGYGMGTGQQVTLPLDNAQLSDKGFMVEGRVGAGYNLNRVISVGFTLPVSWGYLFKKGDANDSSNQYQSIQAALMLDVRFRLKAK